MSGIRADLQIAVLFLRWAIRPTAFFVLSFSTAYAAGWVSTMPGAAADQELCQVLLDRLNHTDSRCLESAVDEYPGFSSPPWRSIDPNQHLELVAKLTGYRGGPDAMTDQQWSAKLQGAKEFKKKGGALKIWRTRLLNFFDSNGQFPIPPGDQTIVLMSSTLGLSDCPTHSFWIQREIFVVLPDLSGPDVRVKSGVAYGLANSHLVSYKGSPLFIDRAVEYSNDKLGDGSSVMIYRLIKDSGAHAPVCWFQYSGNNQNSMEK